MFLTSGFSGLIGGFYSLRRKSWLSLIGAIFCKILVLIAALSSLLFLESTSLAQTVQCSGLLDPMADTSAGSKRGEAESRPSTTKPKGMKTQGAPASAGISRDILAQRVRDRISSVPEFRFIRDRISELKIKRVWMFGGTAATYLHYAKWDVQSEKGKIAVPRSHFDYELTSMFSSNQDLDIVIDGTPEQAVALQDILNKRFPGALGAADRAVWEVRTLRMPMGRPGDSKYKEGLLGDRESFDQTNDSQSIGMIEISEPPIGEPLIRDLRNWDAASPVFFEDALHDRISFLRSPKHYETYRAKNGENSEFVKVIRTLVKAFKFGLRLSEADEQVMSEIVGKFVTTRVEYRVKEEIERISKKLLVQIVDLEKAVETLDRIGLRKKLISLGDPAVKGSVAWQLNRKPLPTFEVGSGSGKTAGEYKIDLVAHETESYETLLSITRSLNGRPQAFMSQSGNVGSLASFGDGFYVRRGGRGYMGKGNTVRFKMDPNAREGTDFLIAPNDYVIVLNAKVLTIVSESNWVSVSTILEAAEKFNAIEVDPSNVAQIERTKRKIGSAEILEMLKKMVGSGDHFQRQKVTNIINSINHTEIGNLLSEVCKAEINSTIKIWLADFKSSLAPETIKFFSETMGSLIFTDSPTRNHHVADLASYLLDKIGQRNLSLTVRHKAALELLKLDEEFNYLPKLRSSFDSSQLKLMRMEIFTWRKSLDPRKVKVVFRMDQRWSMALADGNVAELSALLETGLYDLHQTYASGISSLQLAAYYQKKNVINWVLSNLQFNINNRDSRGFTELEQLILVGRAYVAVEIKKKYPNAEFRNFRVLEREQDRRTEDYPMGMPLFQFVEIKPGSFIMGADSYKNKFLVTITEPYEIFSTKTNQGIYRDVILLLHTYLGGNYMHLKEYPSKIRHDFRPVENIYRSDIILWLQGLSELSESSDVEIQRKLNLLFPGHKQGARYTLPTSAQWEFAARLGGLAEGEMSYGEEPQLRDPRKVRPIIDHPLSGELPPVFYNGKPLYDFNSWVHEWTDDRKGPLNGSIDPRGPREGDGFFVMRGTWYWNTLTYISSVGTGPSPDQGFRMVRLPPAQSVDRKN